MGAGGPWAVAWAAAWAAAAWAAPAWAAPAWAAPAWAAPAWAALTGHRAAETRARAGVQGPGGAPICSWAKAHTHIMLPVHSGSRHSCASLTTRGRGARGREERGERRADSPYGCTSTCESVYHIAHAVRCGWTPAIWKCDKWRAERARDPEDRYRFGLRTSDFALEGIIGYRNSYCYILKLVFSVAVRLTWDHASTDHGVGCATAHDRNWPHCSLLYCNPTARQPAVFALVKQYHLYK